MFLNDNAFIINILVVILFSQHRITFRVSNKLRTLPFSASFVSGTRFTLIGTAVLGILASRLASLNAALRVAKFLSLGTNGDTFISVGNKCVPICIYTNHQGWWFCTLKITVAILVLGCFLFGVHHFPIAVECINAFFVFVNQPFIEALIVSPLAKYELGLDFFVVRAL